MFTYSHLDRTNLSYYQKLIIQSSQCVFISALNEGLDSLAVQFIGLVLVSFILLGNCYVYLSIGLSLLKIRQAVLHLDMVSSG